MTLYVFCAYLALLFICSVTGFYCTGGLKRPFFHIKLLAWFVLFTFITEIISLQWSIKFGSNHCVYNIYLPFYFCFYSYMHRQMIKKNRIRRLLTGIPLAFVVFAVFNICLQGIHQFNAINFITSAVTLSFFSCYALNELFKKDIGVSPFKTPFFWIACSILVLNSCMIPLILPATFGLRFTQWDAQLLLFGNMLVNFIAYSMFIVAFLYTYKNNKRTSSL